MNISQIVEYFDMIFPKSLSEQWDNDGVMVCADKERQINKILVTLDVTDEAIEYAQQNGCDLIISHHPLIFKPISHMDESLIPTRIYKLWENKISVLSYHTRFDSADGGINDEIAKMFNLKNIFKFGGSFGCLGRIGEMESEVTPKELADLAVNLFSAPVILYSANKNIKNLAIVSGGGIDCLKDAIFLGADAFLTGEVTYNKALDAVCSGFNLIDAGHYPTEILCDNILKRNLVNCGFDEKNIVTFRHKNPGLIVGCK